MLSFRFVDNFLGDIGKIPQIFLFLSLYFCSDKKRKIFNSYKYEKQTFTFVTIRPSYAFGDVGTEDLAV